MLKFFDFFPLTLGILVMYLQISNADDHPYNIEILKIGSMPKFDKSWIDIGTMRVSRTKANSFVINGAFTFGNNLGDEQKVKCEVHKFNKASNSYHRQPIISVMKPFCEMINEDQMTMPRLRQSSNFPPANICPVEKGTYTVDNFQYDSKTWPALLPLGLYRITILLLNDKKEVAGIEIETEVTMKK